jgi:hypothetical protein
VFFFVDDEYNPVDTDEGKTAFIVKDGDEIQNIFVVAEESSENDIVKFFFDGGISAIMRFEKDSSFPDTFAMSNADMSEVMYINFSAYDEEAECYDATFMVEEESSTLEDLPLEKSGLQRYQNKTDLTADQNKRIRNIYTALYVWSNLALVLDDTGSVENALHSSSADNSGSDIFYGLRSPRFIMTGLVHQLAEKIKKTVVGIFSIVAQVAVVVFGIAASVATAPVLTGFALGVAVVSLAILAITELFANDIANDALKDLIEAKRNRTVFVYTSIKTKNIANNDVQVLIKDGEINERGIISNLATIEFPNNVPPAMSLLPSSMTFKTASSSMPALMLNPSLNVVYRPTIILSVHIPGLNQDVELETLRYRADKNMSMIGDFSITNALQEQDTVEITIERCYDGFSDRGTMPLVVYFGKNVVINDNPAGVIVQNPYDFEAYAADTAPRLHKDLFMMNIENPSAGI